MTSFLISDNGGPCVLFTIPTIELTSVMEVDYSRTITSLIQVNAFSSDVGYILNDKNFPSSEVGRQKLDTAVFHFGHTAVNSQGSAISQMEEVGYRPATIKELLHYPTNEIPSNLKVFRLLALGSVADFGGFHLICALKKCKFEDLIQLEAIVPHQCFGHGFRFLGIKK